MRFVLEAWLQREPIIKSTWHGHHNEGYVRALQSAESTKKNTAEAKATAA
jgi:hypothetical protein